MEQIVIKYTAEQFIESTEPYDYLVSIENGIERDREIAAYKKFALKNCDISASTFKAELKEAYDRLNKVEKPDTAPEKSEWTKFTGQEMALRCPGYYCNDSGVWKDSSFGPVRILMHPIMPTARLTDYETHEHKTAVSFRVGKEWHTQIVSRDVLSSRAAFTRQMSLADAFVTSENVAGVITFLADVESANIDLLPTAHSTGRMGWHDGRFLPYEKNLIFDGDLRFRNAYDSISSAGDRDAWFDLVGQVRRGASVPERCALAAGFASVVLQPIKGMPFCLHLWSDLSSTGKTVALMLAASIWGDPRIGKYCQTLNATNVGVEMLGGFYNSLPLCLDELCTRDNKQNAEDLVYEYCSNAGRVRGSRNGGLQRQMSWCNCMITTGETPILTEDSRAGAENRTIEIEVDRKLFGGHAKQAVRVLQENYGFAGPLFVQAVQQPGAVDMLKKFCDEYERKLEDEGITEKQSKAMAVILAADRFAALKVFDDTYNLRVEDVARYLKREDEVDTNVRAYDALMGAIVSNNRCFEPRDERTSLPLFGKIDDSGNGHVTACIIRAKLGALLTDRDKGTRYNEKSFLKWARRVGVLELDNRGYPTRLVRLSELGGVPTRCICIRMNALDAEKKSAPDGFSQVELSAEDIPF